MTRVRVAPPDTEEDITAEQVAAYLLRPGSGWVEMAALSSPHFVEFELRPRAPDQNNGACGVPREACKRPIPNMLECIHDIARAEQRHPSAVLADIVGPARAASVGASCVTGESLDDRVSRTRCAMRAATERHARRLRLERAVDDADSADSADSAARVAKPSAFDDLRCPKCGACFVSSWGTDAEPVATLTCSAGHEVGIASASLMGTARGAGEESE